MAIATPPPTGGDSLYPIGVEHDWMLISDVKDCSGLDIFN